MYESLHNHTTASDGTQSYTELLRAAERYNFGTMALTDHDFVPNVRQMQELSRYSGTTKWFIGCEISCGLPQGDANGPKASMHMLGQFVDPHSSRLVDHCAKAQAARSERVERIVANLRSLDFTISVDDVIRAAAGGESVGRPHIVRALHGHDENAKVIERIRLEMEKAAIADAGVAMDYALMIERPPSDYPYRLFLSDDAFIKGIYVDYLYWIDMDAAVAIIREAGGVAVMAHWYTVGKHLSAEELRQLLHDGRLDGVELMGNPLNSQARKAEPILRNLAQATGAITTYGIDNHREEEMRGFARNGELARLTVGQTTKIVDRVHPNLTYSNMA